MSDLNDERNADHLYRPRDRTKTDGDVNVTNIIDLQRKRSLLFPLALSASVFTGMLDSSSTPAINACVRAYTTGLLQDIGGSSMRLDIDQQRDAPTTPGVYSVLVTTSHGGRLPGLASFSLTEKGCEVLVFGNPGRKLRGETRDPAAASSMIVLTLKEENLRAIFHLRSVVRLQFLEKTLEFEPSIEGPWLRDRLVRNVDVLNKLYNKSKLDGVEASRLAPAELQTIKAAGLDHEFIRNSSIPKPHEPLSSKL